MSQFVTFPPQELGLSAIPYTDNERDKILLAMQGQALRNPVGELIDRTKTLVDQQSAFLGSIGDIDGEPQDPGPPLVPAVPPDPDWQPVTTDQLNAAVAALGEFSAALSSYKQHSDIMSGADLSWAGFPPAFIGRYGIARAYNQIRETIRRKDGSPCGEQPIEDFFGKVFFSILGPSRQTIQRVLDLVENSGGLASRTKNANAGRRVGIVVGYTSSITEATSKLVGYIATDNANFYEAFNAVNKFTLGQSILAIQQDSFGERMINEVVGNPLLTKNDLSSFQLECNGISFSNQEPNDGS